MEEINIKDLKIKFEVSLILEINPDHDVVTKLNGCTDDKMVEDVSVGIIISSKTK